MINLMLNAALDYERLGFSVIPLRPKEKTPLLPWTEYQKRRASPDEIRKWWDQTPDANVGVVTGFISSIAVVDLDGPLGLSYGIRTKLTSPMTSITGKGRQLFYKYREGICSSASKIAEKVDVRGEPGYVVAPPSVHPNGKRYTWVIGALSAARLPDFPDLLPVATGSVLKNGSNWVSESLAGLKAGNRDDTFTRIVGKLHHSGLDADAIRSLLAPHARSCSFGDLDKVIQSVGRYPTENNGSPKESADIGTFLQESEPVEWIVPGIIARGAVGFVAGLPETLKTWLLMDLAVESARGGGDWLGTFPVKKARVLYVDQERFKGETQRRFRKLMSAKKLDVNDLKGSLFVRCGTTTRLNLDESFRAFRQELLELKPDLVIIDSFATFHTENDNDRQAIQPVLERIKQLRNEIGCTFIFIDHESKSVFNDKELNEAPSAFRMMGSIGKTAAAEFVLTVRKYSQDESVIWHTKSTLSQTVSCFNVKIKDVEDGIVVGAVK